jgi:urate oxidase
VRVMKVDRSAPRHKIYEYEVDTILYSPTYERVFTDDDNTDLVATDTQKNTVYIIAKRSKANCPEVFASDLASHFMKEYPILSKVEVECRMVKWERSAVDGNEHDHAFEKCGDELAIAKASLSRIADAEGAGSGTAGASGGSLGPLSVKSSIRHMTILKSTQSGFEGYLQDKYTLLPPTAERCLATELECEWTYNSSSDGNSAAIDYIAVRTSLKEHLKKGLFGPSTGGVYSASLQSTIYDAACNILEHIDCVESIRLDTPNIHYLPMRALEALGEKFEDDVFIPTSEPSGTITCTVARSS